MSAESTIAVLGAGSWGTALALRLVNNRCNVRLWEFDREQVRRLQDERTNEQFLPGFSFPDTLTIFPELSDAVDGVKDVLIAVPSHAFRAVLQSGQSHFTSDTRVVWATKGLDPETNALLHDCVKDVLSTSVVMAVLSGPSFAKEVAADVPTAVTIAATDKTFAQDLKRYFSSDTFHVDLSDDLVGVQLGGVVKNVMAIAVGIADGLGYGANTRCALITRGLHEMTQLGLALGAKSDTFAGLSGVGDLVLTCSDDQSRNRRFGLALGHGQSVQAALDEISQVVEGRTNAEQVYQMAQHHKVNMPIVETVRAILENSGKPSDILRVL